jgi:hypothetical protein
MSVDQYTVRPQLTIKEDEITGYVDPWVVSPGDTADVKVRTIPTLPTPNPLPLIQAHAPT